MSQKYKKNWNETNLWQLFSIFIVHKAFDRKKAAGVCFPQKAQTD